MKKVLHILNTGSYSGAENIAISIINNTKDIFESVYLAKDGSIRGILEENNIEFYPVKKLSYFTLRQAMKDIQPDIIHAHDFTAGITSAITFWGIPIINHLHNNSLWLKKINFKSILYAVSTIRYKKILTVSDSVINEFVFSSVCSKKVTVIENFVDIQKITGKVENKSICKPYEIAFLGRLSPEKNPCLFLDIIYKIKQKIPNVQARMIGNGVLYEKVEAKVKELDLENNVTMLGFQRNPYEYLYQAQLLCMPSLWEGFGLAAVEALALGKPVVAASVGGLVNIVDDSCGKLCASEEEYVNEISILLTDSVIYQEKSENALIKANKLNNISNYISKISEIYNKIDL